MIRRLFVANRGEIALRVLRTAHRLGLETVLGVSEADRGSLPARLAQRTVLLGPGPAGASYLDVGRVVEAARASGCDALHPGYGFLSENAALARALARAGIAFVGPTAEQLDATGDKLAARAAATAAGLPVVPGGEARDAGEARRVSLEVGLPLLVKAVAGGGGRGMKRVAAAGELESQLALAAAEAQAAFGDGRLYVERFVERGRHVEVQVLGDGRRAIHLGDRDCSIQRRFQKLVEEAPAPDLPAPLRAALHAAAVALARHLAYRGAGTVEFLVDVAAGEFFFLEMNARIQVEHPVTEAITGIDLIEQQLNVADGLPLSIEQQHVRFHGHAIEVRINAEDWRDGFRPSPGKLDVAAWPAGAAVRVDTHLADGGTVPAYYDSLMGKLIVHAATRAQAIDALAAALAGLRLEGLPSTAGMHEAILRDARFRAGAVDTRFFEKFSHG